MNRSTFKDIKLYVGAMSKNCVDAVLEMPDIEKKVGFISSRRQIDYCGGYVNNWSTKQFSDYVRLKNKNLILCRDHGGESQGTNIDDGKKSYLDDSNYLNLIHIDPWKKHKDLEAGTMATIRAIKAINKLNKDVCYEIGTEESIRRFTIEDLQYFLGCMRKKLSDEEFDKIVYCVIQSGVGLDLPGMKNTGTFSEKRLIEMINTCKSYNLLTKEHNSDYLNRQQLDKRYSLGLDAANIAPELGQIETLIYVENCDSAQFLDFYKECFISNKWKKWVDDKFDPDQNKRDLVKICGHYIFAQSFCQENLSNKNEIIVSTKAAIKKRITELVYD